jgi:hypothetical protein
MWKDGEAKKMDYRPPAASLTNPRSRQLRAEQADARERAGMESIKKAIEKRSSSNTPARTPEESDSAETSTPRSIDSSLAGSWTNPLSRQLRAERHDAREKAGMASVMKEIEKNRLLSSQDLQTSAANGSTSLPSTEPTATPATTTTNRPYRALFPAQEDARYPILLAKAEDHWRRFNRRLVKELEAKGELQQALQNAVEQTIFVLQQCEARGLNPDRARELAYPNWQFPAEKRTGRRQRPRPQK